jgi:hypothetical protein
MKKQIATVINFGTMPLMEYVGRRLLSEEILNPDYDSDVDEPIVLTDAKVFGEDSAMLIIDFCPSHVSSEITYCRGFLYFRISVDHNVGLTQEELTPDELYDQVRNKVVEMLIECGY